MVGDELKRLNGPIFITGHTGFKGSWLSLLLKHLGIEHFGYSLEAEVDSLYRRANLERTSRGVVGDIRNVENLSKVLKEIRPSILIHLAAQPLVLQSYKEPLETFQTNCIGTANVLKAAFETPSVESVLVITTDKVYQNENTGRRFIESDPLGGKDPYSASKVAAESACSAWQKISETKGGPRVLVARAGNVIGGGDLAQNRLIPDIIRAISSGKKISIRNPRATRPWQHTLDPLWGYLKFLEKTLGKNAAPSILNFGPSEPSLEVAYVVESARNHFTKSFDFDFASDLDVRDLESYQLDLDSSLARESLGWRPLWTQEQAINRTFRWWEKVLDQPTSVLAECDREVEYFLKNHYENMRF
jgi:CDP-glucose 4,6-dehydratase